MCARPYHYVENKNSHVTHRIASQTWINSLVWMNLKGISSIFLININNISMKLMINQLIICLLPFIIFVLIWFVHNSPLIHAYKLNASIFRQILSICLWLWFWLWFPYIQFHVDAITKILTNICFMSFENSLNNDLHSSHYRCFNIIYFHFIIAETKPNQTRIDC